MSFFEAAIGILVPPQCVGCRVEGSSLCTACSELLVSFGERCWRCNAISPDCRTCPRCRVPGAPSYAWIHTNYEGIVRDLMRRYKFSHQRAAARPISKLMVSTFHKFGNEQTYGKDYLVVPVPTATSRMRQRGFGHSELLAKTIASQLSLRYYPALRRLGQSRQVGARRDERLKQLDDSFSVKSAHLVSGRNILLIDDVITTGGTIMAATKKLRAAGAKKVDALLLAKKL